MQSSGDARRLPRNDAYPCSMPLIGARKRCGSNAKCVCTSIAPRRPRDSRSRCSALRTVNAIERLALLGAQALDHGVDPVAWLARLQHLQRDVEASEDIAAFDVSGVAVFRRNVIRDDLRLRLGWFDEIA